MSLKTTKIAQKTRLYRKIHRWLALPLAVFLLIVGLSGLLLGWKKQTKLLPKTENSDVKNGSYIKLDSIETIAKNYAKYQLKINNSIDRIDIRPQKGVAKIVFSANFTELQIDCYTGKILAINTRNSDFIEKLHDGSILDFVVKTENDFFKLAYTSFTSLGLILLSFTGFWLWYNPKRIRNQKHS